MRIRSLAVLYVGIVSGATFGRPTINATGIVNAASYHVSALDSGGIAPGGLISIFGSELGPKGGGITGSVPLQTELGGVRVRVIAGNRVSDCPLLFVSERQINAVLPSSTPLGAAVVKVVKDGEEGNAAPVRVVKSQPGVFSWNGRGTGGAVATDMAFVPLWAGNPARPGQTVILWGTGLGGTNVPSDTEPMSAEVGGRVSVLVGNVPANVLYAYRSGCCVGLDQVAVEIPSNVLQHCSVPVAIVSEEGLLSNMVTLPISGSGQCSAGVTGISLSELVVSGGDLGTVQSLRTGREGAIEDSVAVSFQRVDAGRSLVFGTPHQYPAAGTCLVQKITPPQREFPATMGLPFLDGGPFLELVAGAGVVRLMRSAAGTYGASSIGAGGRFFDDTAPVLKTSGGRDIPAFQTMIARPTGTEFTLPSTIVRSRDLELRWPPEFGPGRLAIFRLDVSGSSMVGGWQFFYDVNVMCSELPSAGVMTIPSRILGQVPSADFGALGTVGFLSVEALPAEPQGPFLVILGERRWSLPVRVR